MRVHLQAKIRLITAIKGEEECVALLFVFTVPACDPSWFEHEAPSIYNQEVIWKQRIEQFRLMVVVKGCVFVCDLFTSFKNDRFLVWLLPLVSVSASPGGSVDSRTNSQPQSTFLSYR